MEVVVRVVCVSEREYVASGVWVMDVEGLLVPLGPEAERVKV